MLNLTCVPAGLGDAPLKVVWKGARAHVGSTERDSRLLTSLTGTTTCAQLALIAGVLHWGSERLAAHTDVSRARELAEALLVFGVDWRLVDLDVEPRKRPPDGPAADSGFNALHRGLATEPGEPPEAWTSYYPWGSATFHAASVVQHILGKPQRRSFDDWLTASIARMHEIAAKPDEPFRKRKEFASAVDADAFIARHRGEPLPPEVLEPSRPFRRDERAALVERFLAGLDPARNRFLRTPGESTMRSETRPM